MSPGGRPRKPVIPQGAPPDSSRWFQQIGEECPHSFESLVAIGKVGKAHGVGGAFQCVLLTDYPERFEETEKVHLHKGAPPVRTLRIESAQLRSGRVVLKMAGIDTPESAELLKHAIICAGEEELVELEEGEYFHFQLENLRVVDENGAPLGVLAEVLATPAHEIYVIQTESGELLIPAVDAYVLEINLPEGFMKIRVPVEAQESDFA